MSTDKPIEPKARYWVREMPNRYGFALSIYREKPTKDGLPAECILFEVAEVKELESCQEELKEVKAELLGVRKTSEFLDAQYYKQRNELSALQAEKSEEYKKHIEDELNLTDKLTALESANSLLSAKLEIANEYFDLISCRKEGFEEDLYKCIELADMAIKKIASVVPEVKP